MGNKEYNRMKKYLGHQFERVDNLYYITTDNGKTIHLYLNLCSICGLKSYVDQYGCYEKIDFAYVLIKLTCNEYLIKNIIE